MTHPRPSPRPLSRRHRALRPSARASAAALAALALALAGCGSGKRRVAEDRQPITDLGVGATVIMPGQSVPMRTGGPGTGNLSYLGGAAQDVRQRTRTNQSMDGRTLYEATQEAPTQAPPWLKAAAAPAAVAAEPFRQVGELLTSADNGAGTPRAAGAPPAGSALATSPDPNARHEAARLEALERELGAPAGAPHGAGATRAPAPGTAPSAPPPPTGAAAPVAPADPAPPAGSRRASIAEELAALQATIAPRPRPEERVALHTAMAPPPDGLADRVRDRDGDGRPDQWSYHDPAGRPTRELLDEDGDGAPDRTVWFEPATGDELRVEEDTNLDGRTDSWVEYREGRVARQRRDTDHDGQLDTWSFYDDRGLARQEQDTTGDGFRDRMAFYEAGRLRRERQDRDGDGRVDVVTVYDEAERPVRRDEDSDGDGEVDVRSVYEEGRLVRRELVDAAALGASPEPSAPPWEEGDAGAAAR